MASIFDGVTANFTGAFLKVANAKYGTSFEPIDQTDWDFTQFTKEQVDAVWVDIKATKNFWQTLRPLEGTSRLRLSYPHELVFITSREASVGQSVHDQSCHWLRQNFYITYPQVIVVENPSEKIPLCKNLGISTFIDDKVSTVLQMHQAGLKSYVRLQPYNCQKPFPEGVIPVDDLNEFLKEEAKIA